MKKILYIITQSEFGGAQRYIFDLATNLSLSSLRGRQQTAEAISTENNKTISADLPRDRFVASAPRDDDMFEIIMAAGENPNGELFTKLNIWKSAFLWKSDFPKIETTYLKHLKRAINPLHDLLAFFELRRLIKKENPDIIHLNSSKAGVLGSLAAKFAYSQHSHKNSRHSHYIIYTAHGWVFNEPLGWLRKKIYFYAEKWTAKFKDKIICVSEHDRQIAIKSGFPANKLVIIHNGININQLKFLPKEQARQQLATNHLSLPPKADPPQAETSNLLIVGTIANLYPTKGIEYLVEAASHLRKLDFRGKSNFPIFLIIGEGPERPKLEKLIQKYNLKNNFFLLGHIPDAYKYLKAFDIFVLPSLKEGFPYAILEAMSAGLPIVATKVGGVPEIIDSGNTGWLIEPKNSHDLAEKITTLLKDENLRENLSAYAKQIVTKNFSLAAMIEKTKEIYFQ